MEMGSPRVTPVHTISGGGDSATGKVRALQNPALSCEKGIQGYDLYICRALNSAASLRTKKIDRPNSRRHLSEQRAADAGSETTTTHSSGDSEENSTKEALDYLDEEDARQLSHQLSRVLSRSTLT